MKKPIQTILASASPRRLELLNLLSIFPEVRIPCIDETPMSGEIPDRFVQRTAVEKGMFILKEIGREGLIISADTIVLDRENIIGKPDGRESAFNILKILSGKVHRVITGISLLYKGKQRYGVETTEVEFSNLSDKEINYYLDTEEYMDKAGAYAIQGKASIFVKRIEGCYFNVMGFPLNLFYSLITDLNIGLKDLAGPDQ